MSTTYASSTTSTCTASRAEAVLDKVLDDLVALQTCLPTALPKDQLIGWLRDILSVLVLEAAESVEVQLTLPDGTRRGLRYVVSDDGSLAEDGASGGINYYMLPESTRATLFMKLRQGQPADRAREYLRKRGWTFNGVALEGSPGRDRTYSRDGYGLTRYRFGL